MVKLASARESRKYGARRSRKRGEYVNAGLYLVATVVMVSGFAAEFSREPKSGLVVLMIGLGMVVVVNLHDLVAHLAGIEFRLGLVEYDGQLGLVEFGVPVVQTLGTVLSFLGILFLFLQAEKSYGYFKLEKHALHMLIAGPVLWVFGSILNSCQTYERADGHLQFLQSSVQIPFLMASLLFLVGSILNSREQIGSTHHGVHVLGKTWVWFGIFGGLLLFIGGMTNLLKVFKMQQMEGMRLEKLRGGAQEELVQGIEGRFPLILEHPRRRKKPAEEDVDINIGPTPYKDVLTSQA